MSSLAGRSDGQWERTPVNAERQLAEGLMKDPVTGIYTIIPRLKVSGVLWYFGNLGVTDNLDDRYYRFCHGSGYRSG